MLYDTGHFPWLVKMFKGILSYTEMGKALGYIAQVALDLIKARRQGGHNEKVDYGNAHLTIPI